jgi:hypothetical protein
MNDSDLRDIRDMAGDASDKDKAVVEQIIVELEREFSIVCNCGCGARKRNDGRIT